MCTFYTKNGVFLPGDSRALSALRGACVKFTTQRGVNSVSYLFSSVFRRRDQCLSSLTWCPCIACTGTAIHVWTQTVPSPWADSYLLTLWWGKCGHPSCVPLQQQNSDDSELKDLFLYRTNRQKWSLDPGKGAGLNGYWTCYLPGDFVFNSPRSSSPPASLADSGPALTPWGSFRSVALGKVPLGMEGSVCSQAKRHTGSRL